MIRPEGVTIPNVPLAQQMVWPQFGGELQMTTRLPPGREYSLLVGSSQNPFSRPNWLPSDDHTSGFRGRWGNRVAGDPQARRAGYELIDTGSCRCWHFAKRKARRECGRDGWQHVVAVHAEEQDF